MTDTTTPSEPDAALLRAGRFFRRGTAAPDLHSEELKGGREGDAFYRDRWSHDKVVNSTHTLRIPLEYLAEQFAAGDTGPVRASLEKLAAMRSHMRAVNLGGPPDPAVAASVGMDLAGLEAMYRLLAVAKYEDRYVIPTAAVGDARRLEESAVPDSCSLDQAGGPGMGGEGAFGQDSGRTELPLVSLETFHALRAQQTADEQPHVADVADSRGEK